MFWLEEAGLPMTGANIARAMQLSPPTVHEMIGRLIDDGYVDAQPRQIARLHRLRPRARQLHRPPPPDDRALPHRRPRDPLGRGPRGGGADRARDVAGARGADAGGDRRRDDLPARPPDRRGRARAGLAARRRRGRRRRHILRFENEAEELLHYLKAAGLEPGPGGQGRELRRRPGRDRLRRRQPRGLAAASPRPSRSAPTRRRRRGRRFPSSWSSPRTATGASAAGAAARSPLERGRDPRDALRDPLRRDAREREAEAVLAALDHEVGAGDEGDVLGLRLGEQRRGVGALGEVEPEEVAAAGDDELGLRDLLAERRDERVARACSAPLTNSMLRSRPPERQSSRTIDSASMFGEM